MTEDGLVALARRYCEEYHQGQTRRGNGLPYSTHPVAVAEILARQGYNDLATQCMALLHDIIEDAGLVPKEIKNQFGFEIAHGIYVLSRNTITADNLEFMNNAIGRRSDPAFELTEEHLYKLRISCAPDKVKRVKIADMIHNTTDLGTLRPTGIARKIDDSKRFYIPIGRVVAPPLADELEANVNAYEQAGKPAGSQ